MLVWRRLRGAGAASLMAGAWVLPDTPAHAAFLTDLVAEVRRQGGTGLVLRSVPLDPAEQAGIVARFIADREVEYQEFAGRCADFEAEMARETAAANFTFAELEENEQELNKLVAWLDTIRTRDAFPGERAIAAQAMLEACRDLFTGFGEAVYAREWLAGDLPADGEGP